MSEVVRTSMWTAQHTRAYFWYVTRRVWLADGSDTWEPHRTESGRTKHFRTRENAQALADSLNEVKA